MRPRSRTALLTAGLAAAALFVYQSSARTADQPAPDKGPNSAAVGRARETVQLLDELNKNYIVQVTNTYVKARELTPAATVAKRVFKSLAAKDRVAGRLLDATGKPFNDENAPASPFEKTAIGKIKGGMAYYDEVGTKNGQPVLRAATVVPAVNDACVRCHTDQKVGDVLGALVYEVAIK
jgi:hypothetical protein